MTATGVPETIVVSTWKDSVNDFCIALDIGEGDLYSLLDHLHCYYYVKHFVSRSGKQRTFYVARGRLLAIHEQLVAWLSRLYIHDAAHGWRKGHSPLTAVTVHISKPYVVNLDIADFYPSVSPRRVRNLFLSLGCVPKIADILTRLTTYKGHLAQGLKTSPAIANLVMVDIDRRIDIAARQLGFTYTRYGDDITLSGSKGARQMQSLVTSILRQTGFTVKPEKNRLREQHKRQTALNLVVNAKPNLPSEKSRKLRSIAHNCLVKGLASEQQPDEDLQITVARIRGLLSHWAQINRSAAQSSQRKFEKAVENHYALVKQHSTSRPVQEEGRNAHT